MSRHAYCIIAHNEPTLLQTLINLIDDERNDIFILYDKKAIKEDFAHISSSKSLIFTPPQNVDIRWGDISQVDAELTVLEAAVNSGNEYGYLHLISGVDLPLKTQNYIHDFFASLPKGTNLIGIASDELNIKMLAERTEYYHLFTNQFKQSNVALRWLYNKLRSISLAILKLFRVKRDWSGMVLGKGSNWGSITMDFARYLVTNRDFILKIFRGVPCADECYKQTILLSSDVFRNTLPSDEREANGRKIDWTRGGPYVWRECDYEELMKSTALFARKFSTDISEGLIDRIYNSLSDKPT